MIPKHLINDYLYILNCNTIIITDPINNLNNINKFENKIINTLKKEDKQIDIKYLIENSEEGKFLKLFLIIKHSYY